MGIGDWNQCWNIAFHCAMKPVASVRSEINNGYLLNYPQFCRRTQLWLDYVLDIVFLSVGDKENENFGLWLIKFVHPVEQKDKISYSFNLSHL